MGFGSLGVENYQFHLRPIYLVGTLRQLNVWQHSSILYQHSCGNLSGFDVVPTATLVHMTCLIVNPHTGGA